MNKEFYIEIQGLYLKWIDISLAAEKWQDMYQA
jgi:hypothetical protein